MPNVTLLLWENWYLKKKFKKIQAQLLGYYLIIELK